MAKLRVSLTPALKKLEIISKGLVNTKVLGKYKSVFKGHGLEFESYREYQSGIDDASMIDWKASVRGNKTLVKEFVEERNVDIFFLVDVSSSMVFGSTTKLKNEYAAELAVSLSFAALSAGDSVGYALFTDKIVEKGPPALGYRQFYILSKTLTNTKNYGGNYNLDNALKFLMGYLKESTVVIIISDFVGLKGSWDRYLKILSHKYDVIGIMVRDPRDRELPDEKLQILLQSPYNHKQILINPHLLREKYKSYVSRQEHTIKDTFIKSSAGFISLSTDKEFIKPVMEYFKRREKTFS